LPANVRAFTGASHRPLRSADLSDGVHPEVGLPPMPPELPLLAKKEWRRVTPLLLQLNLLTKVDRSAIARYCVAWGEWILAVRAMKAAEEACRASGQSAIEARFYTTPTGFQREHVRSRHLRDTAHELEQAEACFGMNPSARARVVASRNDAQYRLPGLDDDDPQSGFAEL